MAKISSFDNAGSILSNTSRVEAPFIKVTIGGYTFGVYEGNTKTSNSSGVVSRNTIKYPNYIQNLKIEKTNGIVNKYTLAIIYPINEFSDPNFFEKLFSISGGEQRKITFSYGDASMPEDYIYKNEEAIITNVSNSIDIKGSVINYTVSAVSTSSLTLSGAYNFTSKTIKPSDEIMRILYDPKYHLTDIFTGMKDRSLVEQNNLIAGDDRRVIIQTRTNISALDYINYLVSCMNPTTSSINSSVKSNIYSLATFEDNADIYGGPYFKIQKVQKAATSLNQLCTYNIDIGYPTANIVTDFRIQNNENWSIYYNYNMSLNNSDFRKRIDSNGNLSNVYSPQLTNTQFEITESDKSWWTRVTQYPISASITVKGLLKPAILMQYIKLNVWFYGHKHISSGYYIITGQEDSIGFNGFTTTLSLLRVAEDDEMV